jgi:hypothetical protein
VKNANNRRVAKNCRAFLIGIKKLGPEGKREDHFPNDVRELRWTHDHSEVPAGRDLLPGVTHWVDVAGTHIEKAGLAVCVFPSWALFAPGDYVFSVQVALLNPSVG